MTTVSTLRVWHRTDITAARQTQLSQSDVQRSSLLCCPQDEQSVLKTLAVRVLKAFPRPDHSGPGCVEPGRDGGQGPSLELRLWTVDVGLCDAQERLPLLLTPPCLVHTACLFLVFLSLVDFPYPQYCSGKRVTEGLGVAEESLPGHLWFCVHQQ